MNTGHVASGFAAGTAGAAFLAPALGLTVAGGITGALVLGTVFAAGTLAPDIDTKMSKASTAFGPVSQTVHRVTAWASGVFTEATGTRWDERKEHRGLTHTLLFTVLAGLTVALAVAWQPRWGTAVVFGTSIGILARVATKPGWSSLIGAGTGVLMFFAQPVTVLPGAAGLGVAAGLGMLLHILGDMVTRCGVPLLAPFVAIRGKRWWAIRPPLILTFHAGQKFEKFLIVVFAVITVGSLIYLGAATTTG